MVCIPLNILSRRIDLVSDYHYNATSSSCQNTTSNRKVNYLIHLIVPELDPHSCRDTIEWWKDKTDKSHIVDAQWLWFEYDCIWIYVCQLWYLITNNTIYGKLIGRITFTIHTKNNTHFTIHRRHNMPITNDAQFTEENTSLYPS
jgi:hypothetical protein